MPNHQRKTLFAFAFAMLSAGLLTTSPVATAAESADSPEVSQLLSEAKTQAFQLKEDAATLASYTASDIGKQTHAEMLNQMKDHVNAVGRQLAKLEQNRESASSWQKTAIDRIRPLLQELAADTSRIINILNQKPGQLKTGDYKDYVEANADLAAQLSEMIGDFVDYGKTKQRFERLGEKLELPATGSF
jgi:chromosome segregation ATPase